MNHPSQIGRGKIVAGLVVPGLPHPLLVPDANEAYGKVKAAYDAARAELQAAKPDVILLYSTQWLSVIGHQVQTDPKPKWLHVDQEWHELGSIPYEFAMDSEFGESYVAAGQERGLEMRGVSYHGFPIDTGSIVALKMLNPDNEFAASIVSCNMYADRSETIVLGKAARDAIKASGKRVAVVAVTALSNRMHTDGRPFSEDCIHSQKDDEWNRKYLEFLSKGRIEDASQLARQFSQQANGDQRMKAVWWLNSVLGQTNQWTGKLHAYEPIYGTGAAIVSFSASDAAAEEAEFDEEDAETYDGDRNVLGGVSRFESAEGTITAPPESNSKAPTGAINAAGAPAPVGAYPHARRVGDFLYLSGLGPRDPATNEVPGGPVWKTPGKRLDYDAIAQTEAVISNMKMVLASAGASIDDVVDVTCYLIDMERDFEAFNAVYAKHFGDVQATRTTLEINRLPTPIAVEFKVVAKVPGS